MSTRGSLSSSTGLQSVLDGFVGDERCVYRALIRKYGEEWYFNCFINGDEYLLGSKWDECSSLSEYIEGWDREDDADDGPSSCLEHRYIGRSAQAAWSKGIGPSIIPDGLLITDRLLWLFEIETSSFIDDKKIRVLERIATMLDYQIEHPIEGVGLVTIDRYGCVCLHDPISVLTGSIGLKPAAAWPDMFSFFVSFLENDGVSAVDGKRILSALGDYGDPSNDKEVDLTRTE